MILSLFRFIFPAILQVPIRLINLNEIKHTENKVCNISLTFNYSNIFGTSPIFFHRRECSFYYDKKPIVYENKSSDFYLFKIISFYFVCFVIFVQFICRMLPIIVKCLTFGITLYIIAFITTSNWLFF